MAESAAIAVVAVVAVGYFSTDYAGGSGYLGAFLAGLIVGNMDRFRLGMHSSHERDMRALREHDHRGRGDPRLHDARANLPWSDIWDNLGPALAVVVGFILLARPLTVLALPPADRRGRWTREEIVFLSWTRETGVVAAALAGLMVAPRRPGLRADRDDRRRRDRRHAVDPDDDEDRGWADGLVSTSADPTLGDAPTSPL